MRTTYPDGRVVRHVYDGDHLLMELDAGGNVDAKYTYYPGVDRPHAMIRGGVTYYYGSDQQGSVLALFNGGSQVVNRYSYLPFGEAETVTEGVANPLRYAGREYEGATGLYYNRNRWYDPMLHRFISEDPISVEGGMNLYAYVGNDPVNLTDPFGLYADAGEESNCRLVTKGRRWALWCETPRGYHVYAGWLGQNNVDPNSFGRYSRRGIFSQPDFQYTRRAMGEISQAGSAATDYWAGRYNRTGSLGDAAMGSLAALAINPDATLTAISLGVTGGRWANRPFWRYIGPSSSATPTWLTRGWGWRAPYGTDYSAAADALQLPSFNPVNSVISVRPAWWQPVVGPRPAIGNPQWGAGGGPEYFIGWRFPK